MFICYILNGICSTRLNPISVHVRLTCSLDKTFTFLCTSSGGARGIQGQYQPCQQLSEEDVASEREVAPVWLPLLLLHVRLQFVARHLPQQEGNENYRTDSVGATTGREEKLTLLLPHRPEDLLRRFWSGRTADFTTR